MAVMNTGLGDPVGGPALGFGENVFSTSTLAAGNLDDGSVAVDITSVFGGSGIDYFGTFQPTMYINSNGLITFAGPVTTFNPVAIDSFGAPAIAPFWSDVNLNSGGEIYWDLDPVAGTVTVTWFQVAPFTNNNPDPADPSDPVNSFQVVLTNTGDGDFSVEFIYGDIQWTDGNNGPATVGFTDGGTNDVVLPGSGDVTALENFDTVDFGNGDPDGTWEADVTDGVITSSNGIVDGTAGDDVIDASYDGDPENDFVDGADGTGPDRNEDIIDAGAGNDEIDGGAGNDTIYGNSGDDEIDGGAGDDTIFGDSDVPRPSGPFNVQYFEIDGAVRSLFDAGFQSGVGTETGVDNVTAPTAEFEGDDLEVNSISLGNDGDGSTYAVRFETTLTVTTGGTYTFGTASDDGSQLFIDGDLVVTHDGLHGVRTR
jgi:hypothetical protein